MCIAHSVLRCRNSLEKLVRLRRLCRLIGTTSSPFGTARARRDKNRSAQSTTIRVSSPPVLIASLTEAVMQSRSGLLRFHAPIDLGRERFKFTGDFDWIGHGRFERAQGLGQSLKLALGVTPNFFERR